MAASTTVLTDQDAVLAALPPLRRDILRRLQSPESASSLARELGLARQKVNYHLRELERHGLVRLVAEQPRRGLTERFFIAAADRMLVDPELLVASPYPFPAWDSPMTWVNSCTSSNGRAPLWA